MLVGGCQQNNAPSQQNNAQQGDFYFCEEYGYSMSVPSGWIIAEAPDCIVSFLGNYDYFVNVVAEVDETNMTQVAYIQDYKEKLERSELMVNTNVLQWSQVNVNGHNAHLVDYTYEMMSKEIKARTLLIFYNGNVYGIVYQTEVANFDDHLDDFSVVLDSFELV